MTASITHCSARLVERLLRRLLLVLLALFAAAAVADDARILHAEIIPGDSGYVLNADNEIDLNPRLADAVMRGVSLYFMHKQAAKPGDKQDDGKTEEDLPPPDEVEIRFREKLHRLNMSRLREHRHRRPPKSSLVFDSLPS
jgi:hypothetical protein